MHPGITTQRSLRKHAVRLLLQSRMTSTRAKHMAAWRAWKRFCRHINAKHTDVSEHLLVLFVAWLSKVRKVAHGTARQYTYGVCAFFTLMGTPLVPDSLPRMVLALDGFKRMSPATKRKPKSRVTMALLRQLKPHVKRRVRREATLWALMVTATQGLFRLGELVASPGSATAPRKEHLRFCGSKAAALFLPDSKTDYLRKGVEVFLANIPGQLCAPPLLAELHQSSDAKSPLFCVDGAAATKHDVLKFLQTLLSRAGVKTKGTLKGHSFRQGGAQSLFDAGVSIEDIKIFGRWKSDAFRSYIEMSLARVEACHARMATVQESIARWDPDL